MGEQYVCGGDAETLLDAAEGLYQASQLNAVRTPGGDREWDYGGEAAAVFDAYRELNPDVDDITVLVEKTGKDAWTRDTYEFAEIYTVDVDGVDEQIRGLLPTERLPRWVAARYDDCWVEANGFNGRVTVEPPEDVSPEQGAATDQDTPFLR